MTENPQNPENRDQPDQIDVKQAINQSTSRVALSDLAKRGIKKVKVLDERMIQSFISDAVGRMLARNSSVLSEKERKEIFEASRTELNRLVKEHQATRERADLAEQGKNDLIQEVMNLQKQINLLHKVHDDDAKKKYDEGAASQQELIHELRGRVASLEEKLTVSLSERKALQDEIKQGQEQVTQAKTISEETAQEHFQRGVDSQQAEISDLRQHMQELEEELHQYEEEKKAIANERAQTQAQFQEYFNKGVASKTGELEDLQQQVNTLTAQLEEKTHQARQVQEQAAQSGNQEYERGAASRQDLIDQLQKQLAEAETDTKEAYDKGAQSQQALVQELRSRIADLEKDLSAQKAVSADAHQAERELLRQKLEEMGKSDSRIANNLEALFEKMTGTLGDKISQIKVAGGTGGPQLEFASVSLENMFKEELESNLSRIAGHEKQKTRGMGGALAKLKAMKGTEETDPEPAEEKPDKNVEKVDGKKVAGGLAKLKQLKKG